MIVLDGCMIHRAKRIASYCSERGISRAFTVPYSPWFNGIEEVWALAKIKFKKEMLLAKLGK